jgi:thiamine-monophosphate kinase
VVQVPGADRKPGVDPLQLALHGGDDYELLFTVSPEKSRVLPRTFGGVGLTPIGRITEKQELIVSEENSRERHLVAGGWDPFRNDR